MLSVDYRKRTKDARQAWRSRFHASRAARNYDDHSKAIGDKLCPNKVINGQAGPLHLGGPVGDAAKATASQLAAPPPSLLPVWTRKRLLEPSLLFSSAGNPEAEPVLVLPSSPPWLLFFSALARRSFATRDRFAAERRDHRPPFIRPSSPPFEGNKILARRLMWSTECSEGQSSVQGDCSGATTGTQ